MLSVLGKAGKPLTDPLPLYTVKEAAALTGWHPRSLNRLLKQGRIEALRVGWQYLFTDDHIEALRARQRRGKP